MNRQEILTDSILEKAVNGEEAWEIIEDDLEDEEYG